MTEPPEKIIRLRFETLTAQHNVAPFECEIARLSEWLHTDALDDMQAGRSHTYVALGRDASASADIVGYITLKADYLVYKPKGRKYDIIDSMVEIKYLARDWRWNRRGVGPILLFEAFRLALLAQDTIGGFIGVHLMSNSRSRGFYKKYGFGEHPYPNSPEYLFMTMADVRAIFGDE